MKDGEIKYSMFCNDNGGIIDDFIVYRCAADNYWLVVNAGNREKDAAGSRATSPATSTTATRATTGPDRPAGPKSGDILKSSATSSTSPPSTTPSLEDVPLNLGERTIRALVSQDGLHR